MVSAPVKIDRHLLIQKITVAAVVLLFYVQNSTVAVDAILACVRKIAVAVGNF